MTEIQNSKLDADYAEKYSYEKAQRGTEEAVIRISGNQGVGYQGIRGSGKRIDTDFVWLQKGTKGTKKKQPQRAQRAQRKFNSKVKSRRGFVSSLVACRSHKKNMDLGLRGIGGRRVASYGLRVAS